MAPRPGFIHPTAVIGSPPEMRDYEGEGKGVFIASTAQVNAHCTIDAGADAPTYVGPNVFVMAQCHIGHDAVINPDCELAPGTVVGGRVELGVGVHCGIGALIRPRVKVGSGATIGAGAVVTKDVPQGETWVGNPAKEISSTVDPYEEWGAWYDSWHDPVPDEMDMVC